MDKRICKILLLNFFMLDCLSCKLLTKFGKTRNMYNSTKWNNVGDFNIFLKHAKIIEIIDASQPLQADENTRALDQYELLVKHFMLDKNVAVSLFKSTPSTHCKAKECSTVKYSNLGKTKKLILMVYESVDRFKESVHKYRWSIFQNCSTSFYVLVMMDRPDGRSTNEAILGLQQALSATLNGLWRSFEILDVLVTLPGFCGSVLAFNPLKDCSKGCFDLIKGTVRLVYDTEDLQGYPLKANVFHRNPTLLNDAPTPLENSYLRTETKNIGSISGVDAFVLANLVKYLNFSVIMQTSIDRLEYGSMMPNGTFTGSLGDVIYRRSDISINARFLRLYSADGIELTHPIYSDKFCLIVPKSPNIPYSLSIFLVFEVSTWGLIAVTATLMSVVWWIFKTKLPSTREGPRGFMVVLDMLLLIISRPIKSPHMQGERIFIFSGFVFNLVFAGIFQGYLMTAYSTTKYYKEMDTLESVVSSGLPIMASNSIGDLFVANISTEMDILRTRTINHHVPLYSFKRDGKILVERSLDAKILIERFHTDDSGFRLLHVNSECPRYFYLAYMVRKGYPFLPHIDRFIMKAAEAGLIGEWYAQTEYALMLNHRMRSARDHPKFFKLTLEDVQTAFILLVMGQIISFLTFLFEFFAKCTKTPHHA